MEKNFNKAAFKEKLEAAGQYPMLYMFKFIVPMGGESDIAKLFPDDEVVLKPSSGGKYVSTTIQKVMGSPDEIIAIYERAAEIEGVISF